LNLQKLVPLIASEKYREAFKKLSRIVKRSPRNPEAWFLLSFVYQKHRQRIYSLEKTLKYAPDHKFASKRLQELNSGTIQLTPISTYYPPDALKKKAPPAFRIFLNFIFIAVITASAVAVWLFFLKPAGEGEIDQQVLALTEIAATALTQVALIPIGSTPTPDPDEDIQAVSTKINIDVSAGIEIIKVEQIEANVEATRIAAEEEAARIAAEQEAARIAEEEAAAAAASANQGPALDQFINQIKNGNGSQVVGIFVEGNMALTVVQQPSGNAGYVNESYGTATYFAMVRQYTGNDGLLAHNYLSGGQFFYLWGGQSIYLIYGNGQYRSYSVNSIKQYQATDPLSPYSNFIDLNSGATLDSTALFYSVYGGSLRLTLQTCINRDGDPSWGRYFVISSEY